MSTRNYVSNQVATPGQAGGLHSQEAAADRYFYILDAKDDRVWEWDGYPNPEGNGEWLIQLMCPLCENNLTLTSINKKLEITEEGIQSADPLRCSHEAEFGGICKWGVVLELPKPSEREATVNGQRVLLDAVAKRIY